MARLLKDYKREELRCLIVEDFQSGDVFKVTNKEEIENALNKYTEHEITKVYNPSPKQRAEIFDMMSMEERDGKIETKVDGNDMLMRIIPLLTDIKIDLSLDEDVELINDILDDPNEVFQYVVDLLNDTLAVINARYIENLKTLGKMPAEALAILNESVAKA
ncbi:MAG: hypothetical protein RSC24_06645 [Clostridium sp.]